MKNKKPAIRFKGFSEEWEEKELGEVSPLRGGFAFQSQQFVDIGVPIIKISNILQTGEIGGEFDYYKEKEDDVNFILPDGAALLAMSGATTGKVSILKKTKNIKFYQNQRVGYFSDKGIADYTFISTIVRSEFFGNRLRAVLVAGAQPNVSSKDIDGFIFNFPNNFKEQTRIGNFFKNLDSLIMLHQRKYEKLRILKKAMLEKMFPKNGADVPEIRFKGFEGAWEEKTLGDLFGITSASRVHKHEWRESGVPFFRSSDVVSDYKGQENTKAFISFELYEELAKKSGCVQKNDILVTGGGSIGIPYLVKSNEPLYFKDADLLWLKNSDNMNGYFLYTFFSTSIFRSYVSSITHIGTISHYTIEQAKATPIKVPKREEQDKIGEYLTNLDNLLTLHQGELGKLKNLKKAMLEKMFV